MQPFSQWQSDTRYSVLIKLKRHRPSNRWNIRIHKPQLVIGGHTNDQLELRMSTHDMDDARSTYDSFMSSLKWIVPLIVVITFIVIMLIAE